MDMLNDAQRNRHVKAGQRLWYSKLAVHQLGKEQMRSLTAEVEQLVEHGFSIAVLVVARPRGPCSMASWSMVWSHGPIAWPAAWPMAWPRDLWPVACGLMADSMASWPMADGMASWPIAWPHCL